MPADMDWRDYFGIDKVGAVHVDVSPRFEEAVIEETDEYTISTTDYGATLKKFKIGDGTPEFLDFKMKTYEGWLEGKARMVPCDDRIDWADFKLHYNNRLKRGEWIQSYWWFGFDVIHSWAVGTETFLIAMAENEAWAKDMIGHYLHMNMELYTRIWDAGYRFDCISWPDDMGYKGTQFFSLDMYRNIIKPYHKAACDWAHNRGIYAHLHSCGNIMSFVPDLIEIGVDALNPLEVKAGMDSFELKRLYGDRLVLHGGINAVLWDRPGEIIPEMEKVIPVLKQNGGYIFSSDHSVPHSVSLDSFRTIINKAKELGKY
jgi:uroporphyrinogen decarboxylase